MVINENRTFCFFFLIFCYIFNQNYQRIPDSNSESTPRFGEEAIFERDQENEQPLLRDRIVEQFDLTTQNNVSSNCGLTKICFLLVALGIFFCVLMLKALGN